jgi:hypothetical protein
MTPNDVAQAMQNIAGVHMRKLNAESDDNALLIRIERGPTVAKVAYNPSRTMGFPLPLEILAIGTTVNERRSGAMRSVMVDLLHVADGLGLPISLEAIDLNGDLAVADLVDIYEKFGFREIGQRMPGQAAKMVREPGAAIKEPALPELQATPPTERRSGLISRIRGWLRLRSASQ